MSGLKAGILVAVLVGFGIGVASSTAAASQEHSFPVGKVEFLDVRPMSFWEFLRATHLLCGGGRDLRGGDAG